MLFLRSLRPSRGKKQGTHSRMRPCLGWNETREAGVPPVVRLLLEILDEGTVVRNLDGRILTLIPELNFIDHATIVVVT